MSTAPNRTTGKYAAVSICRSRADMRRHPAGWRSFIAARLNRAARRATRSAVGNEFPFWPHVVAGVAAGVSLQVVLMFWFGFPEFTGRRHLGDHRGGTPPRCVDIGDGVARDALLLVIEIEDRRAVAGADVVALAVLCRRVMDLEKEFEQGAVVSFGGVVGDLDRLGVTGMVAVGRVVVVTAGIADPRRFHIGQPADEILG